MNDVQFCASDVLEVRRSLLMSVVSFRPLSISHRSCCSDACKALRCPARPTGTSILLDSTIVRLPLLSPDQALTIRAEWVTRDKMGATFYHKKEWETRVDPPIFPDNAGDRKRWDHQLPVQMSSCWNGIAVVRRLVVLFLRQLGCLNETQFSAEAFLPPHSLAFRTSHHTSAHSEVRRRCFDIVRTGSWNDAQCLLISIDLWKAGLGRIVMTPRARVAYSVRLLKWPISALAVT